PQLRSQANALLLQARGPGKAFNCQGWVDPSGHIEGEIRAMFLKIERQGDSKCLVEADRKIGREQLEQPIHVARMPGIQRQEEVSRPHPLHDGWGIETWTGAAEVDGGLVDVTEGQLREEGASGPRSTNDGQTAAENLR